jgi:Leucine-rich repeat (LRR) protein
MASDRPHGLLGRLNLSTDRFASGFGLIAVGAFAVAPASLSPFLGGACIVAGIFVWLSDSHIVNGRFTATRPRTLQGRIAVVWPQLLMFACAIGFVFGLLAYMQRDSQTSIDRLAALGWTVKPSQDDILFEIWDRPLPPMQESANYLAQLDKPFRLHFQQVKSLEGLHYLANLSGCTSMEISAGEFTDVSELREFTHLTKLVISQVPLNGPGVVDPSPLGSLVNLQELVLGMTRIRTADFLSNLVKMKRLYLGRTLISDISSLAGLSAIEFLDLRETRITDLSPIGNAAYLSNLEIGAEQLPGLSALTQLPNLKRLSLIDQGVVDLSTVGSLKNLESFFVWGPSYLNLLPLQGLTRLSNLQVSGLGPSGPNTQVDNAQAIGVLAELKILSLGYLKLSDVSFVQGLRNLTEIAIATMPITSVLPLRNLKTLRKVTLTDTPVVDISPLLDLPNLSELYLLRVPARADVLKELERRGVKVTNY